MFKGQKITHINKWLMVGERVFEIVTVDHTHYVSECLAKMIAKHEGFKMRVYFS